jgi:hypothetical protein
MNKKQHIIETTLKKMISEQETPEAEENNGVDIPSIFSEPEKKFLGSFDKAGSNHVGIIYSISDIGIREFIARSGAVYNCTPALLLQLIRDKIIKIVPYGGWGRDDNYTLELQIPLEDVKGFGAISDEDAAAEGDAGTDMPDADLGGGDLGGGLPPPAPEPAPEETAAEEPAPEPENAGVIKYGDLLKESIRITRDLLQEKKKSVKKKTSKTPDVEIHLKQSRILNRVPKEFIHHLKRVIKMLQRKTYTKHDQERLIADIIDNLQVNFDLTNSQVKRAFEFHRNQKRLQKLLDKK